MDVGIIGGADGPTAIYITSGISPYLVGAAAVLCIAAVAIIVRKIKKGKM